MRALLDVNVVTLSDLQQLPGIGPVMANRIVAERAKAPFRSVDVSRRRRTTRSTRRAAHNRWKCMANTHLPRPRDRSRSPAVDRFVS